MSSPPRAELPSSDDVEMEDIDNGSPGTPLHSEAGDTNPLFLQGTSAAGSRSKRRQQSASFATPMSGMVARRALVMKTPNRTPLFREIRAIWGTTGFKLKYRIAYDREHAAEPPTLHDSNDDDADAGNEVLNPDEGTETHSNPIPAPNDEYEFNNIDMDTLQLPDDPASLEEALGLSQGRELLKR
ncbi:hypothetical protein BDZ89DRAFT_1041408 [Hymenopellis radicata]|nr:hypothetical protein BDZ89DRAFT_1041408 [Hymenopellis radicata]